MPVLYAIIALTLCRDELPYLYIMSSFSPITYISELEDRFQHDRRSNILQEIDVVALDLVRKALRTRDLFAVVLVRNQCYFFVLSKTTIDRMSNI